MEIRWVEVENYRCLRKVHLRLAPLTVLVGPNGSGKTAILDALQTVLVVRREDSWRKTSENFRRAAEVTDRGSFDHRYLVNNVSQASWTYLRLHLQPSALRQANQLQQQEALSSDGSNLVNVFATLPRKTQDDVARRLRELVPLYADVNARPLSRGDHRLVFQDRWDANVWYEPSEVSDGSIVMLAFLMLPYLNPPVDVLAIEEPEHALHPFLLGEVVSMLRDLAHGRLSARPVQVALATHSAQLLNFLEPEEVRFLKRNLEDGSTVVEEAPVGTAEWQAACHAYQDSLGEMWLSGGLGGVPGIVVHE
jgi:predicted ATPase